MLSKNLIKYSRNSSSPLSLDQITPLAACSKEALGFCSQERFCIKNQGIHRLFLNLGSMIERRPGFFPRKACHISLKPMYF